MEWNPKVQQLRGSFCTDIKSAQMFGVELHGAATIEIGAVTILPAGSQPYITNTGTKSHAVLNFALPATPDGVGIQAVVPDGTDGDGGNIYQIILTNGEKYNIVAPKGSDATDKHYVHNQATASNTWVIHHNLGKCPSVTVQDSAGTLVVGEIEYTDNNTVTLRFSAAFGGKAYLN